MNTKTCPWCNAEFTSIQARTIYCSHSCNKKDWQRKRRQKDRENARRRLVRDLQSRWRKADDAARSAVASMTDTMSEYEDGCLDQQTKDRRCQRLRNNRAAATTAKQRIEAEALKAVVSIETLQGTAR